MPRSKPPRRRGHAADETSADQIFRAIADYTYDWESWIDVHGVTRWINPAVERITGHRAEACLAMPDYPLPLVHQADRRRIRRALEAARKGGSGNDLEFRVLRKDGSVGWGAISWQSVFDAQHVCRGYRTSVRDISSRKQAEEELRQAKVAAEQASRTKGEFLANMSHEIRSPIQCISGYAQLLTKTKLTAKQRRYLTILCQQNDALLKVVDAILDFSALQTVTPRLELHPFEVRELVGQVVEGARPLAHAKHLRLSSKVEASARLAVLGDAHRLRQILANLLSNAIKFTESGSVRLLVTRTAVAEEGAPGERLELTFMVEDTGIGISSQGLGQLFRPFAQADSSTARRFGGTGLGLAISRRLAELMGGSLSASSEVGRGSVFKLSLPFALAHKATTKRKNRGPARRKLPPRSILVVEDSPVALELALELLAVLGYKAEGASAGPHALEALERKPFDLVLMDVQMPVMDGLTLTRMIRRRRWPHGRQPHIVALTANVLFDDRRACMDAGMDAFLGKPLRLEDLRECLVSLVEPKADDAVAVAEAALPPVELDEDVLRDLKGHLDGAGRSILDRYAPRIIADLRQNLDDLDAAFKKGVGAAALKKTADIVHGAKGHARTVGAREPARLADQLEQAAREGDWTRVQRLWPPCRKLLLRLAITLEGLIQPKKSPPRAPGR